MVLNFLHVAEALKKSLPAELKEGLLLLQFYFARTSDELPTPFIPLITAEQDILTYRFVRLDCAVVQHFSMLSNLLLYVVGVGDRSLFYQ